VMLARELRDMFREKDRDHDHRRGHSR
jgi:hypothetical protein